MKILSKEGLDFEPEKDPFALALSIGKEVQGVIAGFYFPPDKAVV